MGYTLSEMAAYKQQDAAASLRRVLLANAASCLAFGLLFVTTGKIINEFIGNQYPWVLLVLGLILLVFGVHLVWATRRESILKRELAYFILGDVLWVLGTLALILAGRVVTTTPGILVSIGIAMVVALFGVLQLKAYRTL